MNPAKKAKRRQYDDSLLALKHKQLFNQMWIKTENLL